MSENDLAASVGIVIAEIARDSALSSTEKATQLGALSAFATPLQTDKWIYRLVVAILGAIAVGTVVGGFWVVLTGQTNPIPDGLVAIGSAAVGALAGLLAPSPGR